MPFSTTEYEVINFVEQTYLLNRHVPSAEVIAERLNISPATVGKLWERSDFEAAITARGIELFSSGNGVLTAQQLMLANTLLDFTDTRSQKKKLSDLKISSQTYQGWLRDPAFQAYLTQRAENLLPDLTADAHLALADNVRRGDLGSIKLFYEMTGRWSSKTVGELNVEFLLMKILEAVQKHVSDPTTLENIAEELATLGAVAKPEPIRSLPPTNSVFDL